MLVVGSILVFSGCFGDDEVIKPPMDCPQFEIYDLPTKVDLSDIMTTGKTTVQYDFNVSHSVITVGLKGFNPEEFKPYSILSAIISPIEVILETIDYTTSMRTDLEKYKTALEIHQEDNTTTEHKK